MRRIPNIRMNIKIFVRRHESRDFIRNVHKNIYRVGRSLSSKYADKWKYYNITYRYPPTRSDVINFTVLRIVCSSLRTAGVCGRLRTIDGRRGGDSGAEVVENDERNNIPIIRPNLKNRLNRKLIRPYPTHISFRETRRIFIIFFVFYNLSIPSKLLTQGQVDFHVKCNGNFFLKFFF